MAHVAAIADQPLSGEKRRTVAPGKPDDPITLGRLPAGHGAPCDGGLFFQKPMRVKTGLAGIGQFGRPPLTVMPRVPRSVATTCLNPITRIVAATEAKSLWPCPGTPRPRRG